MFLLILQERGDSSIVKSPPINYKIFEKIMRRFLVYYNFAINT